MNFWMNMWRILRFIRGMKSGSTGNRSEGLVRDGRPLFHFQTIQMATHLLQYIVRFIQLFVIDKRVTIMLKNNIEVDVKVKCIENEKTQAELAKEISITPSYVNRLIRKNENVVNKTFLAMMEALGYDVTLVYEKRDR